MVRIHLKMVMMVVMVYCPEAVWRVTMVLAMVLVEGLAKERFAAVVLVMESAVRV